MEEALLVVQKDLSSAKACIQDLAAQLVIAQETQACREQQFLFEVTALQTLLSEARAETEYLHICANQLKDTSDIKEHRLSQLSAILDEYNGCANTAIQEKDKEVVGLREL